MNGLNMDERTYNRFSHGVDNSIKRLAAILSLLEPLQEDCFDLTCAGQLGSTEFNEKSLQEQQAAAHAWMKQNYERVSAAVLATILLATDSLEALEWLSNELLYPIGKEIKEKRLELVKGGQHSA